MKKDNPNLIIAKMDATANDVHPLFGQLKGYPTLFFLPVAHKREPVQYEGTDFSYKSLKAFVNQQTSIFLTDEERVGLNTKSAPASEVIDQEPIKDGEATQTAEPSEQQKDEL